MKLGTETGSVLNHLYSRMVVGEPTPAVGMGVTLLMWTDRAAGTIVEIRGNVLVVTEDEVKRVDSNGMSEQQQYKFTTNLRGRKSYFKKDRKGMWVEHCYNDKGRLVIARGCGLRIGERNHYRDFSF
jgi:hypothetical protein